MRRYARTGLVVLSVLALGAAACGDGDDSDEGVASNTTESVGRQGNDDGDGGQQDDGGGHDRDEHVQALSGFAEQSFGFTPEEAACTAEVVVDVVGVEELDAGRVDDQIRENPDGSLSDFGIELDAEQGSALFDGVNACKDMRTFFRDRLVATGMLSPELTQCVLDELDEATYEEAIVRSVMEGDPGLDTDDRMVSAFVEASGTCNDAGIS